MRWTEAVERAAPPVKPELPITIAHSSGSYQEVYPQRWNIYPAGTGSAIITARISMVNHVLTEFGVNDDGWYVVPLFSGLPSPRLWWWSRLRQIFRRRGRKTR